MCGLIGMFGNLVPMNDKPILKQGLLGSSLRGPHSTGVGFGYKDGSQYYYKRALNAQYYLDAGGEQANSDPGKPPIKWSVDQWINDCFSQSHCVIGHNRWATMGEVSDRNAHPFLHDNILLAHNGGIRNHHSLTKTYFSVDSEAITKKIAESGIVETLKAIEGDFSLVWHDSTENTFNLVRNAGRPMFIAEHQYRQVWYYASEKEMLEWLLTRNRISYLPIKETTVGEQIIWNPKTPARLETIKRDLHVPRFQGQDFWGAGQGGYHHWDADDWQGNNRGPYGRREPIGPTQVKQNAQAPSETRSAVSKASDTIDELTARRKARESSNFPVVLSQQDHAARLGQTWDKEKGWAWLKSLGVVGPDDKIVDRSYIGWFGTWVSYPITDKLGKVIENPPLKDITGKIFGRFDNHDEVDCLLRRDNCELLEFVDKDGKFTPDYFVFKVENCRWHNQDKKYVIFVSALESLDWESLEDVLPNTITGIKKPDNTIDFSNVVDHTADNWDLSPELIELADNQPEQFVGYQGRVLLKADFERKTKYGCGHCNGSFDEDSVIHWLDDDSPLCGGCMDDHFNIRKPPAGSIDLKEAIKRMLH